MNIFHLIQVEWNRKNIHLISVAWSFDPLFPRLHAINQFLKYYYSLNHTNKPPVWCGARVRILSPLNGTRGQERESTNHHHSNQMLNTDELWKQIERIYWNKKKNPLAMVHKGITHRREKKKLNGKRSGMKREKHAVSNAC